MFRTLSGLSVLFTLSLSLSAGEPEESAAQRGYRNLLTKPYLPADFTQDIFDNVWKVWPEPLRSQAEKMTLQQRRDAAFSRYGLLSNPDFPDQPALGYTSDGKGGWSMNCMACHGGKVNGQVIPGLPNSHFGLQTLTEDTLKVKLMQGKRLGSLDAAALTMPLGTTHGTTNAVVFGIIVGTYRNPDMTVNRRAKREKLIHHDMDAPPLWNVKTKKKIYIDGFSPKNHRVIMQFVLSVENDQQKIFEWEDDFKDLLVWIESLKPPKYPFAIDNELANRGEKLFKVNCSQCHGTYGKNETYPEKMIPLSDIGTDPVRLQALTPTHRERLGKSWMTRYGKEAVTEKPNGYIAPPLDGIWASAPYFHNGSVPTLWHVLHPNERPTVWKRSENEYDQKNVGLKVSIYKGGPGTAADAAEKRLYFDTSKRGKSAEGHTYPDVLTEDQKRAVLEYLKTL